MTKVCHNIHDTRTKVNFFSWTLLHGFTLTQSRLRARGFALAERCPLCKKSSEDIRHLFFDCSTATYLLFFFLRNSLRVGSDVLLQNCCPPNLSSNGQVYWRLLARAVLWTLWLERNARVFDESPCTLDKLILKVKEHVWSLGEPAVRHVLFEDIAFNWDSVMYARVFRGGLHQSGCLGVTNFL